MMSASVFRKTELDMPSSVIATLKQGGKQWDLVISIREFGQSSTLRGPVVKTANTGDNRKSMRSRSLAAGAAAGTVSKSRKPNKRKGNKKPAKPAKEKRGRSKTRPASKKPAKNVKPAHSKPKRSQSRPGRSRKGKSDKESNLSAKQLALKKAIASPTKPAEEGFPKWSVERTI